MTRRPLVVALVVGVTLVMATNRATRASISPQAGAPVPFEFVVRDNDQKPKYRFLIEVERVSFLMTAVRDKYKLVRMRVENHTTSPLVLSADRDKLELVLQNATVAGLLNLQSADGPLWDSLAPPMRQTLAYPATVKAGRASATPGGPTAPEVLLLFGFFGAQPITDMPTKFAYTVDSLGQKFSLENRAAAAR